MLSVLRCCFSVTLCVCSRFKLHRIADPLQKMDHLPGVSVVKPLMGVDPLLETNLESHFTLDYPKVSNCAVCVTYPLISQSSRACCLSLLNVHLALALCSYLLNILTNAQLISLLIFVDQFSTVFNCRRKQAELLACTITQHVLLSSYMSL